MSITRVIGLLIVVFYLVACFASGLVLMSGRELPGAITPSQAMGFFFCVNGLYGAFLIVVILNFMTRKPASGKYTRSRGRGKSGGAAKSANKGANTKKKKKATARIPEKGPVNIYVGNLGPTVLEQDLRDLFGAFGQVNSVRIISDRETGESKGYGFIEMAKPADAEQAINTLDGKDLKGQDIKASVSKPKRRSGSKR